MKIHCGQPVDSSVQETTTRSGFLVHWSFVILVHVKDVEQDWNVTPIATAFPYIANIRD